MSTPKFYLDVHIAKEVAIQAQQKGVDIIHCSDIGNDNLSDDEHLAYALQQRRVMVTFDRGFEKHHAVRQRRGEEHGGIVLLLIINQAQSIGAIVNELVFLSGSANYENDLYNQIWRVS